LVGRAQPKGGPLRRVLSTPSCYGDVTTIAASSPRVYRASEFLPRPPCAVLVEHNRRGLSVWSYLHTYPSRFAVVELRLRCDTKLHPLLPLARVRSISRCFPYSSEFARTPSDLVEHPISPWAYAMVPKNHRLSFRVPPEFVQAFGGRLPPLELGGLRPASSDSVNRIGKLETDSTLRRALRQP
jgi:hypothetical protein